MPKDIASEKDGGPNIDPFRESLDRLLVVCFPKSTSANFPLAISIARNADNFYVSDVAGKSMHIASFSKTTEGAGKALALLQCITGWKGVMIFSSGKLLASAYAISPVISCYLDSSSCSDIRAHCLTIIDDPDFQRPHRFGFEDLVGIPKDTYIVGRYSFPCQYLHPWFKFQPNHPSSPQNQIQAEAVRRGCNVCPNFDAENYVKVGDREF